MNSLLELTTDQLMIIFCDAKGCHVADALCKGQYVGVKARDKLIWRLKVFAGIHYLFFKCWTEKYWTALVNSNAV